MNSHQLVCKATDLASRVSELTLATDACLENETSPFPSHTNDISKQAQMPTSLIDIQSPPSANTLISANATVELKIEGECSEDEGEDSLTTPHLESFLAQTKAIWALEYQANNSTSPDKSDLLEGPAQLDDTMAALYGIQDFLDSGNIDLSSLNLLIYLAAQKRVLGNDDDPNLPVKLLLLSKLLLERATVLDSAPDLDHAIESLTQAARVIKGNHTIGAEVFSSLATAHWRRSMKHETVVDIDAAIEFQYQAIASAGQMHKKSETLVADLGGFLLCRYQTTGDLKDIRKAIECQSWALAFLPEMDCVRVCTLGNLGASYYLLYMHLGELEGLSRAAEYFIQAIHLTSTGHPDMPDRFSNLGNLYMRRFERLGELEDLSSAIGCRIEAVRLTPEGHPNACTRFTDLSISYLCRFGRLGELEDINRTIFCMTQVVRLTPEEHPDMPGRFSDLGSSYRYRFERLGELEDLNRATDCHTQSIALISEKHLAAPCLFSNLGISYLSRFGRLGEVVDISRAVDCLITAIHLTPEGHPEMPTILNGLANSCMARFERLDELEDINSAITCLTQAVQLAQEGHPHRPYQFNNLGNSYLCRYQRLGQLDDVERAIKCHIQAVQLTPEGNPHLPTILSSLGNSHVLRYGHLNELDDINKAISCHSQAVWLTPEEHPDAPARLGNLGNSYLNRFDLLGELEDNNKAIDCYRQVVQLIPAGHPDVPAHFSNLGNSYTCRFDLLGELEDVNKAVYCQTQAVQLTPKGHPDVPTRFNNLSNSYICRFERLGQLEDINKVIDCRIQAIRLLPEGHPDMRSRLSNLGTSYLRRYYHLFKLGNPSVAAHPLSWVPSSALDAQILLPNVLQTFDNSCTSHSGIEADTDDLDKAVHYTLQAANITPNEHADKSIVLAHLGICLKARFMYRRLSEDIKSAIDAFTQALHLLPKNHVRTSAIHLSLGLAYSARMILAEEQQDKVLALHHYETTVHNSTGSPTTRFIASRHWAQLLSKSSLSASLPAQRMTMQLLSEIVWLGTTSARRYERITEVGTIAVEAAAAAISADEYGIALEWLEEGRSIVWNQMLQLRTPLDALAMAHPGLAQKLGQIFHDLEHASRRVSEPTTVGANFLTSEQATLDHHRLMAQYNQLIDQVRKLSGFHNFMCPKGSADLLPAARFGPVVVVNVHKDACAALVLTPQSDRISHVPLLALSEDEVIRLHGLMRNSLAEFGIRERKLRRACERPKDHFEEILAALWHKLVKPVLSFLGYKKELPVDQLPHITWCTTGALSFLPIHAAGIYDSGKDCIFDYAITSYTPSLSSLLPTVSQSHIAMSGTLAVSQGSTPGFSDLPGTKHELAYIKKRIAGLPYMQLENSQATPTAVLDAMEIYECVHLACHASQDADAPVKSCFHLHNGTLSLEKIAQRSLKNKALAFLSACQTAMGDANMPDEAIHLAAGMLVAGYPSVIATMWSISDSDAPLVADQVYAQLNSGAMLDYSRCARALHVATGALREQVGEKAFSRWVPYIHIGQ